MWGEKGRRILDRSVLGTGQCGDTAMERKFLVGRRVQR